MSRKTSMLAPDWWDYTTLDDDILNDAARLTPEDMLALSLPGSILESGNYEIRLEGWQDEWPADHAFDPIRTIYFTCIMK